MDTEQGIGQELIERKITLTLFDNLNSELDIQQEKWEERDVEWNQITGQSPIKVQLEHIADKNFYKGHKPSLIEKPPREDYPNISVMVYQAKPTENVIDQASNFNMVVDVELMVKGDNEMEANSRIHRTVEAVHQVLVRNEKLDGLSFGWNNDPIVQITDIFKRREDTSHGKQWYWQAARIRYQLMRHNRLPNAM